MRLSNRALNVKPETRQNIAPSMDGRIPQKAVQNVKLVNERTKMNPTRSVSMGDHNLDAFNNLTKFKQMNPETPTPRTDAMLALIQGGKTLDGADSITSEEDYYDKSICLLKELERELAAAKRELEKTPFTQIREQQVKIHELEQERDTLKQNLEATGRVVLARDSIIDTLRQQLEDMTRLERERNETANVFMAQVNKLQQELMEWKRICKNRDATVKQQGEAWVKAMTERDEARQQLTASEVAVKRMKWLHDCTTGQTDPEGYEWGIYRVKWENGQAVSVMQTRSDFIDLDAEMMRELKKQ